MAQPAKRATSYLSEKGPSLHVRPKFFLALVALCVAPLITVAAISLLANLNAAQTSLHAELENELVAATSAFAAALEKRKRELSRLAANGPLVDYVRTRVDLEANNPTVQNDLQQHARDAVSLVLSDSAYSSIACFDRKRLLFLAEAVPGNASGPIVFRTNALAENGGQHDAKIWDSKPGETGCSSLLKPGSGRILRCATRVLNAESILVSDLRLDTMLAEVARSAELKSNYQQSSLDRVVVVVEPAGEITYHTNDALKHQQVKSSFPEFQSVAALMKEGGTGSQNYRSADGADWIAVYAPLPSSGLSIAIARNSSTALSGTTRVGWLSLVVAGLLGVLLATILALLYKRRTQSLDRVTQDVAAIAKGKLDLHLEARSRDDIRPLADSVNLMTEQMRQQLARETETRQFQAFVRLSAMLTHDLKNAIGSLSLLVSNMEEHFDNEQFRRDAMKSLTDATEKLRALVERISNPVTTLSGEFKRPQAVDLAPIIRKTVPQAAEQTGFAHKIEIDLPPTLLALVDAERMEKVVENLVLNAFEAMAGKQGKLIVKGGSLGVGQIYFSVSDTGVGMSQSFINEKLFHAFATTKKKGMGLGLYTCREVVRANAGTIDVRSEHGAGTTFRVVLPSPQSEKNFSKAESRVTSTQL